MDEWVIKELKCIKCNSVFSAEILKGSDPYWPMCNDCEAEAMRKDNVRGYKMPERKLYKGGKVNKWKKDKFCE